MNTVLFYIYNTIAIVFLISNAFYPIFIGCGMVVAEYLMLHNNCDIYKLTGIDVLEKYFPNNPIIKDIRNE